MHCAKRGSDRIVGEIILQKIQFDHSLFLIKQKESSIPFVGHHYLKVNLFHAISNRATISGSIDNCGSITVVVLYFPQLYLVRAELK